MVGKVVYWLAVLAISFALVVGLVLFFESRDEAPVGSGAGAGQAPARVMV